MQNPRVYISTGGFHGKAYDALSKIYPMGFRNFELSGGSYDSLYDNNNFLEKFTIDFPGSVLQLHNYFPVPHKPFVLNLASSNSLVAENSISHVMRAIDLSASYGMQYYSFHAGFCIDPKPSELGRIFSQNEFNPHALDMFIERISMLDKYASSRSVRLLIENNVCTKGNAHHFSSSPFLFSDLEESIALVNVLPESVGVLLDVAHLYVSSNTLGYEPLILLNCIAHRIEGCHVSSNQGLVDSNDPLSPESPILSLIRPDYNFYTLEVYDYSLPALTKSVAILNKIID
jgi:sugar phosphate isomerase/epimerase